MYKFWCYWLNDRYLTSLLSSTFTHSCDRMTCVSIYILVLFGLTVEQLTFCSFANFHRLPPFSRTGIVHEDKTAYEI
jgi:hypothetical protein